MGVYVSAACMYYICVLRACVGVCVRAVLLYTSVVQFSSNAKRVGNFDPLIHNTMYTFNLILSIFQFLLLSKEISYLLHQCNFSIFFFIQYYVYYYAFLKRKGMRMESGSASNPVRKLLSKFHF